VQYFILYVIFQVANDVSLASNESCNDAAFRKFRRQIFHSSLAKMLESLKAGMTIPEIVRFPDGHFRKVIYGLGPYIADYPEQALLACIVQGWCPK
jgi:Plavaka transposase